MPRIAALAILFALALALAGCGTLGVEFIPGPIPPDAPSAEDLVAALARNDEAIVNFWATGVFTLKSPKLEAVYRLTESKIVYEGPSDLHVTGRKYGRTGLRLTSRGSAFLLEFPTEDAYYYRPRGERFDGVDFAVSPVDIAREAFLPERWSELAPRNVQLLAYDPGQQTADIVIYSGAVRTRPHRRVLLKGQPWVATQIELYDKQGEVIAVTTKGGYRETEKFRFPAEVALHFPKQQAYMRFDMRKIEVNQPPDPALFDLGARVAQLEAEGRRALGQDDFKDLAWESSP